MGLVESDKPAGVERILPRHRFEARVKIQVVREGRSRLAEGWARDLSETGLGAFVGMALLVGEFATLRIPSHGGGEMVIPAQITRSVGTEYGFQFTALSREQRDQIRALLLPE
ncbi:MAG: PilZ domain-containing protein [Terriglobales bacterium]